MLFILFLFNVYLNNIYIFFSFTEGSISRHHRRWCRDAGGEEDITRSGEAARPRRQPVRAAEREERAAIGHQGLTQR